MELSGLTFKEVEEKTVCQWCKQETHIQIYDFVFGDWLFYCKFCQEPINDLHD